MASGRVPKTNIILFMRNTKKRIGLDMATIYIPRLNFVQARNDSPCRIPIQEPFCKENFVRNLRTKYNYANIIIFIELKISGGTFFLRFMTFVLSERTPDSGTRIRVFHGPPNSGDYAPRFIARKHARIPYPEFRLHFEVFYLPLQCYRDS